MWYIARRILGSVPMWLFVFVALAFVVASCGKDAEETEKFPSIEETPPLEAGPITSFRLANGITVYLQEEHSRPEIAVEALYRGGVMDEGEGKTQVSRLLPHMLIFSPTASFKADEAVEKIQKVGRINGEVIGPFAHFDYTISAGQLDLVLQAEAERLTSVVFDNEQLKKYAEKCNDDIDTILKESRLSPVKYSLMAFNQAFYYGKTSIPIYNGVYNVTTDDLSRFHQAHYQLSDMVLVVLGDFDTVEATTLIKQRFENIEERSAPAAIRKTHPTEDVFARWDIDANATFLTFPGPYRDDKERMVLTMFGTYLNRQMTNDVELQKYVKSTYCSNQVYPVGKIPFFLFVEMRRGSNLQDMKSAILLATDQTMRQFNEKLYSAMQRNIISFVESSMLKAQFNVQNVSYYRIIGQEALNVGIKHYLREGRSVEEFAEFVQSISYDEAAAYIESTLTMDKMLWVSISPQ